MKRAHRLIGLPLTAALLAAALAGCAAPTLAPGLAAEEPPTEEAGSGERLILATTTSTADSGLLDTILSDFEAQYGITVDVVASALARRWQWARRATLMWCWCTPAPRKTSSSPTGTACSATM